MARKVEDYLPPIKEDGYNSAKSITTTAAITGGSIVTAGNLSAGSVGSGVVATSGGNTTPAISMGTDGPGIYFGSGAPTISAVKGSLYLNYTGSSSSTRLYVNNGTTTWVAVTTAS